MSIYVVIQDTTYADMEDFYPCLKGQVTILGAYKERSEAEEKVRALQDADEDAMFSIVETYLL